MGEARAHPISIRQWISRHGGFSLTTIYLFGPELFAIYRGNPSCRAEVEKLLALRDDGSFALNLQYFRHHKDDIAYEWHGGEPVCGPLFSQALVDALGPARHPDAPIEDRHRNLAFATQAVYEDGFFNLLNTLQIHALPSSFPATMDD